MFTVALFTIARTWTQPKSPLTGMGKDVIHIHNGILSSHNKGQRMPFAATWIDLEIFILSEIGQTEKHRI